MKAAYPLVLGSALLSSLALADEAPTDCAMEAPCLPRAMNLSVVQKQTLQNIYQEGSEKREALRHEIRHKVLQVLTPQQTEILKAHSDSIMEQQARQLRREAERLRVEAVNRRRSLSQVKTN